MRTGSGLLPCLVRERRGSLGAHRRRQPVRVPTPEGGAELFLRRSGGLRAGSALRRVPKRECPTDASSEWLLPLAGSKAHKIASVPGRTPPLRPPGASGCEHGDRRGWPPGASQGGHTRRSASRRQRNSRGRTLAAAGTARFAPKRRAWRTAWQALRHARRVTSPQRGSAPERAAKATGEATTERGGLRGSGQRPRRANGSEQEATTEPTGGTGRPAVAIPSLRGAGPLGGGWQRRA